MFEPKVPMPPSQVWAVSALLLAVSDALAARFGAVAVRGEIASFSRASSGHCYFSLKDAAGNGSLLRCAMFRRAATLVDFAPADGQQVEARGRLAVYEARGELQFIVESLQRVGAGTLYEEFLRLRARLDAQGLFDPARKRPLPANPRAVAVVTSLNAAALHDVLSALQRRAPHVRVIVVPSLVQGVDAPAALVRALSLDDLPADVETVLLVRGGGSLEDLWAFNDERVVRAVVACRLPVVCGVGHETDITLCDLAADLRAPTPTAAAELAAPSRVELLQSLGRHGTSLQRAVRRILDRQAQRLDQIALRLSPLAGLIAEQSQRLAGLEHRMKAALHSDVPRRHHELDQALGRLKSAGRSQLRWADSKLVAQEQRLAAHDPRQVLRRGYAWVESHDGRPVVSAASLVAGQDIRAVWSDGSAMARVSSIEPAASEAGTRVASSAGTPGAPDASRLQRS